MTRDDIEKLPTPETEVLTVKFHGKRPTGFELGCAYDKARSLERRLAAAKNTLVTLHKYTNELCTAIECAEQDVGGCREVKKILGDLGQADEVARETLSALKQMEEGNG